MVITYATQFDDAVEEFTNTLALYNAAMDDMRKIHGKYKERRDADAKDVEYQRNHLTYVMGDEDHPATERAEAKRKLAQLEFHTCLPTAAEQADYQDARERAELYAHELEDCRDALSATRKALKDAIAADEKATLQNEKASHAWINTHLGRFPAKL